MHRSILRLAIPSILANITVPLVGIVDVAIAGHISDASAMGGIAIGTMLFDLLYWNFGFLRVGTGGMTAQAFGRRDHRAMTDIFSQNISIAICGTLFIWLIAWLFVDVVMWCVPCSPAVESFARQYFNIRIWAAPATLSLMVFKGWFIGAQNTVSPMICDITVNVVNMVGSFFLAVYTPLGAIGVAWGTLIAQYTGLVVAVVLLLAKYHSYFSHINIRGSMMWDKLRHMLALNGNLILRSLGFMVVYVGFTALTSKYGDDALAVGAIMMKLFMLFSYLVDGFAYAGEALVGRFIGEQNREQTSRAVHHLFLWCLGVGILFTVAYFCGGESVVRIMTSNQDVIDGSHPFLFWLTLMPLISCAAFMWDGIYIGATAGRQVRNCMFYAALGFVLGYLGLYRYIGVQAVYVGYFIHLLVRTLYLTFRWPPLLRRAIPLFLLFLLPSVSFAQDSDVGYQPLDSAYMAELEQYVDAAERVQKVQDVISDYEETLSRRERRFNPDGIGFLIRGLTVIHRDRKLKGVQVGEKSQAVTGLADYAVAFSPLAVTWGLRASGLESRSKMPRMVLSNAMALGLTFGLTSGLKSVVDVGRPDMSDNHSMPSRHAAFAFASATILHREYGHLSPWVSVGGYATATATQYLRMRHRSHWLSDLFVGAGIGTVSTNFAYFLADHLLPSGSFNRPRVTMADFNRTIAYNTCPSGVSLVAGTEWGRESKVTTSGMFTAGVEYSQFVDSHVALETMFSLSTAYYKPADSPEPPLSASTLTLAHLDMGLKYSYLLDPSVRFAVRGYAGGRYMNRLDGLSSDQLRPEVGVGMSFDYMQRERYAMGVACDYNHAFASWFRGRWMIKMIWKVLIE